MEESSTSNRLVFVSHSGRDTWVARQIAREVSLCGATPFLDQAHELLVLLTPWALERPYVWAELGAAWGRRIPIVGILHGMTATEFQSRPGIPVFIKKRDLLDINDIDLYFQQLRARVIVNAAGSGGSNL